MRGCLYVVFVLPFVILWQLLVALLKLIPYLIGIIVILFALAIWGGLNIPFLGAIDIFDLLDRGAVESRPTGNGPTTVGPANETPQLIFRFLWRGERIYYLGNEITEEYFEDLATEARRLNGKVEVQQESDVLFQVSDRRRTLLDRIGVNYEIIPR